MAGRKRIQVPRGTRFGRLVVVGDAPDRDRRAFLCVRCDCGCELEVDKASLRKGATRSCGCLRREASARSGGLRRKHGLSGTKVYHAWRAMVDRCTNERSAKWKDYGGRGIGVCDRWLEDVAAFARDMGQPPAGDVSLGRIDNDGDYEPGNCRWETRRQQANNTRQNVRITVGGRTHTAKGWERAGAVVDARTIRNRIADGWDPEEAVTTPVLHRGGGELHHKAKLTEAQVREVRRLGDGGTSLDVLAEMFGVDRRTIRDVVTRRTWRKVSR